MRLTFVRNFNFRKNHVRMRDRGNVVCEVKISVVCLFHDYNCSLGSTIRYT